MIKVEKFLSKEEQIKCFEDLKTEKDPEKIKEFESNLFCTYYKLNKSIAKNFVSYYDNSIDFEDLCSIGSNGLLKAIRSYNLDKGVTFFPYAKTCIKNEIKMALRKCSKLKECSLNRPISFDKDGNSLTLEDTLCDKKDMAQDYIDQDEINHFKKFLNNILNDESFLNDKEKQVIILRYGINNNKILSTIQIAKIMNCSHSYITRLTQSAIEKIEKKYKRVNKENLLE